MDYPPLLNCKHVMHILSCSRPKAEDIMRQPHRPVWNPNRKPGEIMRIHRDIFLAQLEQECRQNMANQGA